MLDLIVRALAAALAYAIQCMVIKAIAGKDSQTWPLVFGGFLITALGVWLPTFPSAGLTAPIFYYALKSNKTNKQALLTATFTAFSFGLMVKISLIMIIAGFVPSLLTSPWLGLIVLVLACALWWAYTNLLQVDYHLLEEADFQLPWYRSTFGRLVTLALIFFVTEFWIQNLWYTSAFLILTGFTLSDLSFRYKNGLKESIQAAQAEHIALLQNSSSDINRYYKKKTRQELYLKDETENLYDLIRFKETDLALEQMDLLLQTSPNSKRIDPLYKSKLDMLHLEAVRDLFEAKFLQAKEADIWVSMEIPEAITVYPIYPLDWVTALADMLDHAIQEATVSDKRYLSYAYFTDADSQHFVLECSCNKPNAPISEGLSDAGLERAQDILSRIPSATLVSSARNGIYRIQIEFDMTKGGYHA